MMRVFLLAAVLLAVYAADPAQAADWKMDAAASRLEFAATYEKTAAPGVFREFDTRLQFDADKPMEGRLDVSIVVPSADMGNADINKAISGPEWFDFARFPRAELHATDIRRTAAGRYVARGLLNFKGVQQAVEVPFAWSETGDVATLDGEITVKRGPFGIGTGKWTSTSVIGPDVTIKFSVRLRKVG